MFRLLGILFLIGFLSTSMYAQKSWVSGTLIEKETKETLPGVKIYQGKQLLAMTDANGAFSIAFEKGTHDFFAKHFSSRTILHLDITEPGHYNLGTILLDMGDEGAGFKMSFELSKKSKYYSTN